MATTHASPGPPGRPGAWPTYEIIRFYRDDPGARKTVRTGLTLEEAQAHCQSDATHGDGWFDGYEEE